MKKNAFKFNLYRYALGGVLFVDEAYALVSGDRDSFGGAVQAASS